MKRGVLYLSYTGMLEPLGQSQVLAYLERLVGERPIHLLSFERASDLADADRLAVVRERIARSGIVWHPRRYHKRPSLLATVWDIAAGTLAGRRLVRRHGLGIVHARSYVPGMMAMLIKRASGAKFVFDMRGFWVDERVDGGLWKRDGALYRIGKNIERRLLLAADHVVSLTHAAVPIMQGFDYLQGRMPPMTVIPTCADLDRFRPLPKPDPDAPFTLGYVGSAGTWYLFDATVSAFRAVRELRPDARFLIVNKESHAYIRERLAVQGVPEDAVELRAASHAEIPALMARMAAGVFFIKPVFSKQASAPTKMAEFLGCGIPCLSNVGVGDMAGILREGGCGVTVGAFDEESVREGVAQLLALAADEDVRRRCVETTRLHFSLDEGVHRYRGVYAALKAQA